MPVDLLHSDGSFVMYDHADLCSQLKLDLPSLSGRHDKFGDGSADYMNIVRAYEATKVRNTEFLFTLLSYTDIESRNILEIGAYRCEILTRFADMGARCYSMDMSAWAPNEAHEEYHKRTGRTFARVVASMCSLPFISQSIDLVYMHATLHHALPRSDDDFEWSNLQNMQDCLREIRRVLKGDGALFLLGENVYPEGVEPSARIDELSAIERKTVYEAAYTASEYRMAFRESCMLPNIFFWHDGAFANGFGYSSAGGEDVKLISDNRLDLVALRTVLPSWINIGHVTLDLNTSITHAVVSAHQTDRLRRP